MNKFVGSISFEGKIEVSELPFFSITSENELGKTMLFCMGETVFESSKEVIEFIKSKVKATLIGFDISISTEDKLHIPNKSDELKKREGRIILTSHHGRTFDEILRDNRLIKSVLAIREAEVDENFGGRVIKVDSLIQI